MRLLPITAALLLTMTPVPAMAQVGITAGAIASDASVERAGVSVDTDSRSGFQIGASYATGGVLGVIVGGYYSEKGFGVSATGERARLSYLEVPVMGVVRLPVLARTIGPRLYAGINGGFEVSCSTEGAGLVTTGLCENTNQLDFGFKGGLGIQVLVVGLDFSYTYGLSDVAKDDALKISNRSWSLGLIFGVG
jgi:hypothetical protein